MRRERIILGCTALLAIISTLYYRLPIVVGLLFILVEVGGTFCLGRTILSMLGIDEGLKAADIIALSLALGYGASLILYTVLFFLLPTGGIRIAYIAVSALALCFCALRMGDRGDVPLVPDDPSRRCFCGFLAAVLVVLTFTFMLPSFLPVEETNSYYLDNIFWIGNNVELTYAIPPDNFRNVLAPDISYHYLSSIRMALIQTTLGIPAFEACFAYSFFDLALLLASAAVMFVHAFLPADAADFMPVDAAAFLLLFSTGVERFCSMSFLSHLYISSFGFGESFSAMLVFLALLKRYWEHGQISVAEAFAGAFVLALCMGHKGTLGFVCLVVAFVVCAVSLFDKERRRFALLFGLMVLAAGLAVYFALLSKGYGRNTGDVSNLRSLLSFPYVKALHDAVCALPLPRIVEEGVFLAVYTFLCHPFCWAGAAIALVHAIRGKTFDVLDAALLIASSVCVCALRLIPMKGFSQSYFFMAAIPLMWGIVFKDLRVPAAFQGVRIRRAVLAGIAAFTLCFCYQLWIPKLVIKDAYHLAGRQVPEKLLTMSGFSANNVNPEEYEALVWVRENLPEDALYMVDVYDEATRNTYFPGSLSQRHVIMQWHLFGVENVDFSADVPSVFKGDAAALEQCKTAGIGYLVQLTTDDPLEEHFPGQIEVVYRNDGVSVYELVGS